MNETLITLLGLLREDIGVAVVTQRKRTRLA